MAAAKRNELVIRRQALGLSQVVFAKQAKIPRRTLGRLEQKPKSAVKEGRWTRTALAVAKFFGCEPAAMFPIAAPGLRDGTTRIREKERPPEDEGESLEPADHEVWQERARELALHVSAPLATAEVVALRRELKWSHELVLEVLAAADGKTLYRGADKKWRRIETGKAAS
jgi:hypothetical protein